ncbi:MAG TPA: DUF6519 domain-containing protein [Chthoniobacteraceae bacterium]|jgi:hypothetical protein|nr:DUF6519 domain-containing protein [Chthoniobacteraceae bacterium]
MKNDISRQSFDPRKHFSRVLQQQGRVHLESDWNEQISILLHYMRTLAADLIGPQGGPEAHCGFEIIDFGTADAPANRPGKPWSEAKAADLIKAGFYVAPGRYYVDGLLCENDRYLPYTGQDDGPLDVVPDKLDAGSYVAYLDVWERHISAAEDADISEVALHGLDTATRAKIVWQIKLLPLAPAAILDCGTGVEALKTLRRGNLPRLRARLKPGETSEDPCTLSPDAQYRGPENQLYRVEIHQVIDKGKTVTFKMSRENGSVVFPVLEYAKDDSAGQVTVTLAHFGPDAWLGLREGDWVELVDDVSTLQGRADPLLKVHAIQRDDGIVTLLGPSTFPFQKGKHPLLRRWDQSAAHAGQNLGKDGTLPVTLSTGDDKWIDLEYGLQVQFRLPDGAGFRPGDYWLIPARVSDLAAGEDGLLLWPELTAADGTKTAADRPPSGIVHHYAPLGIVTVAPSGQLTSNPDCRVKFAPSKSAGQFPDLAAAPDWLE